VEATCMLHKCAVLGIMQSGAGKTKLAKRIDKELDYFVISLDRLVATFNGAYPQLNIRLAWDRGKASDNLAPFLGHFLGAFSSNHGVAYELNLRTHAVEGNRFVLESGYFNFDKILPILKIYDTGGLKDNFLMIGLVQSNKTVDEFFNDFRKYDTEEDWTYGFDDGELREYIIKDAIPFSRFMTDHLAGYGFTIHDTSMGREQVLDKIAEYI